MMLTIGFAFALGVLFPVLMDSFNEGRERIGEFKSVFSIDDKREKWLGLLLFSNYV